MNTHASVDEPDKARSAHWQWYSEWPDVAQVALVFTMVLTGSSLMGSYRWVQTVIGTLWIAWMTLEVYFNKDNSRLQSWGRWRRVTFTGLAIAAIVYGLTDLLSILK